MWLEIGTDRLLRSSYLSLHETSLCNIRFRVIINLFHLFFIFLSFVSLNSHLRWSREIVVVVFAYFYFQ